MNIIERTIYISLIALMVTAISIGYATKEPGYIQPKVENEERQPMPQAGVSPAEIKYSALLTLEINNGYKIYYDAKDEPLVIAKTIGKDNSSVGIEIKSTGMYYGDYMNEVYKGNGNEVPKLYDGPNGWKYHKNESWISTPNPKITQEGGNISKVFLKEICDNVFTITEDDYTGGKYDKEIERLISKIELYGKHW